MSTPQFTALAAGLHLIPLGLLHDSPTQQEDEYDQAYIAELGADIKTHGRNLSPMLVRPWPAKGGYEIVFGHHRKRGCAWAERPEGWCEVREMADLEVERAQISENLHKKKLKPLAEARGFQTLMRNHGLNADQLHEQFGKSRSYIYASLSLLKLCEPVVEALAKGLPVGVAHSIASHGSDSLQQRALAKVRSHDGTWLSERDAKKLLKNEFTIPLAKAPFDLKDENLWRSAGACTDCSKCSTNAPELAELPAGTCVDKDCFDFKCEEHWLHQVMQLQDDGHDVLQEGDAIAAFSFSGYTPLAAVFDFGEGKKFTAAEIYAARPEAHPTITLTYIAPDGEEPRGYIKTADLEALMVALGLRKAPAPAAAPAPTTPRAAWPTDDEDSDDDETRSLASQATRTTASAVDPRADWTAAERAAADSHLMRRARAEIIKRMLTMPRGVDELRMMARREVEMADGDLGLLSAILLDADEFSEEQMLQWVNDASPDQLSAMLAALAVDYMLTVTRGLDVRREIAQRRVSVMESYGVDVLTFTEEPAAQAQAQTALDGIAEAGNDDEDDDSSPPVVTKSPSKPPARYRNAATGETWSGRGLQPMWLKVAIAGGAKLNDFLVEGATA